MSHDLRSWKVVLKDVVLNKWVSRYVVARTKKSAVEQAKMMLDGPFSMGTSLMAGVRSAEVLENLEPWGGG